MPKGFHERPGARAEVDAIFHDQLATFGRRVESRAKVIYRQKLGKNQEATGATERAIRTDFGPSGLTLQVSANRFSRGVNVGLVGHQGHRRIPLDEPRPMKFELNGMTIRTDDVRAVGGWPFLTMALQQVAAEEGWAYKRTGPPPVKAPLPHVRVGKPRRRRK